MANERYVFGRPEKHIVGTEHIENQTESHVLLPKTSVRTSLAQRFVNFGFCVDKVDLYNSIILYDCAANISVSIIILLLENKHSSKKI